METMEREVSSAQKEPLHLSILNSIERHRQQEKFDSLLPSKKFSAFLIQPVMNLSQHNFGNSVSARLCPHLVLYVYMGNIL